MNRILLVAGLSLFGCAGQAKTNTAHDAAAEAREAVPEQSVPAEYKIPEPPKVKADDMERAGNTN